MPAGGLQGARLHELQALLGGAAADESELWQVADVVQDEHLGS